MVPGEVQGCVPETPQAVGAIGMVIGPQKAGNSQQEAGGCVLDNSSPRARSSLFGSLMYSICCSVLGFGGLSVGCVPFVISALQWSVDVGPGGSYLKVVGQSAGPTWANEVQ